MTAVKTRLTEQLGIRLPILNAPMGFHAGGALAAAVSEAGGLGLIGGEGAGEDWLQTQFAAAGGARVGVGFITWSLAAHPNSLDRALAHAPVAVMLSFGDPAGFAPRVRAARVTLICQVQTLAHARAAVDAGADILVAQGTEAGGHGGGRGTLTFVPEVADLLARFAPDVLLVAAGGIADGRGLAAALMLGADGVLIGSRFWTSVESLAGPAVKQMALASDGDGTIRTTTGDIIRGRPWPQEFTSRVLKTDFTMRWHGRETELRTQAAALRPRYLENAAAQTVAEMSINAGEAVGLMDRERKAGDIVRAIAGQAGALLAARR